MNNVAYRDIDDIEAPPLPGEPDHVPLLKAVPRITIHAFCEHGETADCIQLASEDRRLSKAHLTVHTGGILAAVAQYQANVTPNLIIVETRELTGDLFGQLSALAEVCDAGTKVIIIGHVNDISVYREMIRQGVNEYLVAPLAPLQVIEAVSRLYVDPDAKPIGRSIAFMGAKGGAGSSTIAHNVGWCIASGLEEDVIITDLDLSFGTAGLDFNQDPVQGIADALTAPERLDDVLLDRLLVKCTDRLSLFAAPAVLDRDFEMDGEACDSVMEVVRETVPCAIIDLPHIWSPWTKHVLLAADNIVITALPDLASLRNTKNILDILRAARTNDVAPIVVLNQVGVPKRPEIPVKDFAAAIGIEPAMIIPFNPSLFGTASNNGQMIGEIEPKGKTAESFRTLSARVSGREVAAPRAASRFSLFSKKAKG